MNDLRLYLLNHSNPEEVKTACLHFLGDRFQAFDYENRKSVVAGFVKPFRLGRKQKRAILDSAGKEVIVFPDSDSGRKRALEFLNFLNR